MSGPTGPRREQSKNHANAKNETAPLPETEQKPSGAMALHGNSRHFLVQTMLQRTKAGTRGLRQQARKPRPDNAAVRAQAVYFPQRLPV